MRRRFLSLSFYIGFGEFYALVNVIRLNSNRIKAILS